MENPPIETLMAKYCQPAILMRRPYPPLDLPCRNSHLGGRPSLPGELEWPRTDSGTPLHFLAQIDCSELPPTAGVLPDSGILFFFARVDDEMLWGEDDEPARDYCRVLFTAALGEGPVDPPEDLPAIMGGLSGSAFENFRLPGEAAARLYPTWQVEFHAINSWPDASAFEWIADPALRQDPKARAEAHERAQAYQNAVNERRTAQANRLLGTPVKDEARWNQRFGDHTAFPLPEASADHPFPELWIFIDRIARNLVAKTVKREKWWRPAATAGLTPPELQKIRAAALTWIREAAKHPLTAAPGRETALAFGAWLQSLAAESLLHNSMARHALRRGMPSAIQYLAAVPAAAAQIPRAYFLQTEDHRALHQMLGNAGATQTARRFERDEILLLQLESDYGVDFMFCDCGEAAFWIPKDDLAARRFERVFATTAGG
jgi:hypothetical protein